MCHQGSPRMSLSSILRECGYVIFLLSIFTSENIVLLLYDTHSNLSGCHILWAQFFSLKSVCKLIPFFFLIFRVGKSESSLLLLSFLFPPYFPLQQLFCCLDLVYLCVYVCVCVCVCVCVYVFTVEFRNLLRYDFSQ